MTQRLIAFVALILWHLAASAQGELTIRITQGLEGAQPIAIVPFGWQGSAPPTDVSRIVSNDLARSGLFAPLPVSALPGEPHDADEVNFSDWRLLGTANLVVGTVESPAAGQFVVQFRLFDVFKASQSLGYRFEGGASDLRGIAHRISDLLFEHLTGRRGAFNTRIAYVTETLGGDGKPRYSLNIADSDGANWKSVLESREPLLSPAWSPDAKRLAYVSLEGRQSQIFVQNLATGERQRISAFPGLNGAPAWSPDGTRMAMTLSKDGNPEIYVLELSSGRLSRLTQSVSIDTEPAWSPDGRSMVFTSDRSGKPQIYQMSADGGRATRLTFEGDYNARASYAPDGKTLALVHADRGSFRIAVFDLEDQGLRSVSDGQLDESPSFAPNGSMILYATTDAEGGSLAAVSVDGRFKQRLVTQQGRVREPAWSPFRN